MSHSHYDPDPTRHLQSAAPSLSACSVTRTVLEPSPDTLRKFDNNPLPYVVNVPTTSPKPSSRGFVYSSQTSPAYIKCSTADDPRIPWTNWTGPRTKEIYVPTVPDKWWSTPSHAPARPAAAAAAATAYSHACRIMETQLGEQLFGDARCDTCKRHNEECWRYSHEGSLRILNPGSACARCRAAPPANIGCSMSGRRAPGRKLKPIKNAAAFGHEPATNLPQYRISKPVQPGASRVTRDRVLGVPEAYHHLPPAQLGPPPAQPGCSSTDDWRLHVDKRWLPNPRTLP